MKLGNQEGRENNLNLNLKNENELNWEIEVREWKMI